MDQRIEALEKYMITIRKPDDMHVHFRSGDMLRRVVKYTTQHFARALVMPNVPVVENSYEAKEYEKEIMYAAIGNKDFTPLMTIKLTHRTTYDEIEEASEDGVIAAKLYPTGATTGSLDGVSEIREINNVFTAMQDCGMVLCIHAEDPSVFIMNREKHYLYKVQWIVDRFPNLKIVIEHVSTRETIDWVENAGPNVAATITAHHMILTLDDVVGNVHNYCKPIPKTPKDREALIDAAYNSNGKFFFGSDSAPHERGMKECACGCAGVFSAPVAMSVLAKVFLRNKVNHERVGKLERFVSEYGARFYGIPLNEGIVELECVYWKVEEEYEGIVPLCAGQMMDWKVII